MDRKLKIPHSAKVESGFRTTPEECLYDSGLIGLQYTASQYTIQLIHIHLVTFACSTSIRGGNILEPEYVTVRAGIRSGPPNDFFNRLTMVRIDVINFRGNKWLITSLWTDLNGYGFG